MDEEEKHIPKEKAPEKEQKPLEKKDKPKKKRSKIVLWILLVIGLLLLIPLFYAAWLGFIPGLSSLLGANKPVDLGVVYTEQDLESFYDKTGQEILDYADAPQDPATGYKTIFANPEPMDIQLTQEEMTARVNNLDWVYSPLSNIQVRFGEGNAIEVSGNVDVDGLRGFIPFVGGVGYSQEDVDTGLDWLGRMAGSPAVYINSVGTVTNNVLSLTINEVRVGRWTAPLDEATNVLTTATENVIRGAIGLNTQSATFGDGYMDFVGEAPTTVYVKTSE